MNTDQAMQDACMAAAELISLADGIVITAGAGMGIDSGLPDFRGNEGFWRAYPALGTKGVRFTDIANPKAFRTDPATAWGFYGHRLRLYRSTNPHAGFAALLDLANRMPEGAFVFTSNVDGQFQKAGFNPVRVAECHGTIHALQCMGSCVHAPWPATDFNPEVDAGSGKLTTDLPLCPGCGGLARPNILMFGDGDWESTQSDAQLARMHAWLARLQRPVVIELGAGTAIPSVRVFGESIGCPLIRINPRESSVGLQRNVALPLGAREGVFGILDALRSL